MTQSQSTIWNRTEMHSGIRGATELLQQEVGQAGRIATTNATPLTLSAAVTAAASCDLSSPSTNAVSVQVSTVSGLWANSVSGSTSYTMLTTMDGDSQESFRVATVTTSPPSITACFTKAHATGTVMLPLGGFATGIVPPSGIANGSTANKLKLYGDINGDGDMVFIEYYCDNGDAGTAGSHNLYRNIMAWNAASKPAVTDSMILLTNVYPNDPDLSGTARPCFSYQTVPVTAGSPSTTFTFVLDVAVTLTVQTQQIDPITRQYQKETKALLNIAPRNVFATWAMAGMGYTDRIQSTPTSITVLLP
jgi:hypothetical protein